MSDFTNFDELFKKFSQQKFPLKEKKKATFFDVTGFPRYENVVSNILKFLFDNNEEHCFKNLWIKSLLLAYKETTKCDIDVDSIDVFNIKREYSNGSEKRIDLLIDARPQIIVIENKVDASVYNPFDVYTKMAENYIEESQIVDAELTKIVLSVSKVDLDSKYGFVNITYNQLFGNVKKLWWNYNPEEKWSVFAKDFISNLEEQEKEIRMKIDEKWVKYAEENQNDIKKLLDKIQEDIDERIAILEKLNNELEDINFKKGVYNYGGSTYASQYINIMTKDGATICFETYLMKTVTNKETEDFNKLYIALWCRKNKHYNFDYILKAIGKEGARTRVTDGSGCWGKHHILNEIDLCKDFNISAIAEEIRRYVEITSKL